MKRAKQYLVALLTRHLFRLEPTKKQLDKQWRRWSKARRIAHINQCKRMVKSKAFEREYNALMRIFSEEIAKKASATDDLVWFRGAMFGLEQLKKRIETIASREHRDE